MTKRFLWLVLVLVMVFSAACQPAPTATPTAEPTQPPAPTNTAVPPTATPEPALPVLTLVALDGSTMSFTMEELQALPVSEGYGGIKSSTGRITLPSLFRGVALKDLIAAWGEMDDSMGISVVAEDGYAITYSFDQITNGSFIAYDPATGDELKSAPDLTAILAYEHEGEPLNEKEDGTLRLAIISEEPNQVIDGHWAVKWASSIEMRDVGADWVLHMEGALMVDVDRATFESGASPDCHMATWTDDKAQEWVGIPLWTLAGFVDDEVKHDGPAYNDALADAGYTIDVVAADGYTVSFDSTRITRNDNIIVALTVNGTPLPDDYFPLRLVGSELQKNEMIGMIDSIIVHVPGAAAAEDAEPQDALEPELVITGNVNEPQEFMENNLRELEVVEIEATHPKKGTTDTYTGVRFSSLLALAEVQEGATTVVLTASDGYAVEIALTDLQACADCLVVFTDTPGIFNTVMPDLDGSTWTKELVSIEIKGAPAAEADLTVTGLVNEPLALTEDDLRDMEVAEVSAVHPKKGTTDKYEGVLLNTLLTLAGVKDGAATLTLTAGDGYAVQVTLADALACADCIVAFTDTPGEFYLVMPGMDGSFWVKDFASIEIK